jgi:hypothetical protein
LILCFPVGQTALPLPFVLPFWDFEDIGLFVK